MKALIDTAGTFYARSILLVSVLVSLCISKGVGLQLLPIPNAAGAPICMAQARLIEVCPEVPNQAPGRKGISVRVEIVAPKLEGLSHQQSIQILASALLAARHTSVISPFQVYSPESSSASVFAICRSIGIGNMFSAQGFWAVLVLRCQSS